MFEYGIISRDTDIGLRDAVNGLVTLGWRPLGGVIVGYRDEYIPVEEPLMEISRAGKWRVPPAQRRRMYWVQAMVRDTQTEELHHPVTYRPLEVKTQDGDDEVSGTRAAR